VTPFSRNPQAENVAALDRNEIVAALEEEPVKVDDEVKTKISTEIVVEDRRKAGELTHVEVDVDAKLKVEVEDEVGAGEQTQVGVGAGEQTHFEVGAGERTQGVGADERTQGVVEEESAGADRCGSRAAAVMEDWMIDSMVHDIGGWDDELDANAIGRMIVTEFDAAGLDSRVLENGSGGGSEWKSTVRLEPLTFAERLKVKGGSRAGGGELIGHVHGLGSFGSFDLFSGTADGSECFAGFISELGCDAVTTMMNAALVQILAHEIELCSVRFAIREIGFGMLDGVSPVVTNALYDPGGDAVLRFAVNDGERNETMMSEDTVEVVAYEEKILGGSDLCAADHSSDSVFLGSDVDLMQSYGFDDAAEVGQENDSVKIGSGSVADDFARVCGFSMSGSISCLVPGYDSAYDSAMLLVSQAGGCWCPVVSAFVFSAVHCCCCLESPLSVQDNLDHEQSVSRVLNWADRSVLLPRACFELFNN
jgi:hypothetical protein